MSKYVSKSADVRHVVPWRDEVVDLETGEIQRELVKARYRTWSASRRWGVTMKQLRAVAAIRAAGLTSDRDELAAERRAMDLLSETLGARTLDTEQSPPMPS